MTPGVSMLLWSVVSPEQRINHIRLAFKVFHNVEEPIVHVWLVVELYLDLVKIRQGILPFIVSSGQRQTKQFNPKPSFTLTMIGVSMTAVAFGLQATERRI